MPGDLWRPECREFCPHYKEDIESWVRQQGCPCETCDLHCGGVSGTQGARAVYSVPGGCCFVPQTWLSWLPCAMQRRCSVPP